jgi:ATP-dependent RNA helicase RhlE
MSFAGLGLSPALVKAVAAEGYTEPTPIQRQAIPNVLQGVDVVGLAQTGTGKTAAFALPILHRLSKTRGARIRTLVLSPTRELASQIESDFVRYGRGSGVKTTVIFGGVGAGPQRQSLARGVDVVVATPGRLLDLMSEGRVDLTHLEVLVIDEADRMLDMGFIDDVKRILVELPSNRQTLLFSATMPDDIDALARRFMKSPVRIAVVPPSTTVEKISQSVFFVQQSAKRELLLHLLGKENVVRALVFTRTKRGADRVVKALHHAKISAAAIHGNKAQSARTRALDGFKRGTVRVLVATDIAARGIDVDAISHVIQVDLPNVPEQYVHRIGRTARAGAAGIAWAMCSAEERPLLRDIEREIRMRIEIAADHPYASAMPQEIEQGPPSSDREPRRRTREGQGGRHGGAGRGASNASPSRPPVSHATKAQPRPSGVVWSFRPSRRR